MNSKEIKEKYGETVDFILGRVNSPASNLIKDLFESLQEAEQKLNDSRTDFKNLKKISDEEIQQLKYLKIDKEALTNQVLDNSKLIAQLKSESLPEVLRLFDQKYSDAMDIYLMFENLQEGKSTITSFAFFPEVDLYTFTSTEELIKHLNE